MKKCNWPGLVELDPQTFRLVCRLMLHQVDGDVVDLRFLGDRLASQLYSVVSATNWRSIHQEVLLARRRVAYARKTSERVQKKLDRRAYMRKYMKNYRRRGTTSPAGG